MFNNSSFQRVKPLRAFIQAVIPLVYDDSLSMYELVGKVVHKLNEVIGTVNTIPTIIEEYLRSGIIEEIVTEYVNNMLLCVKYPPNGLTPCVGDGEVDDTEAIQAIFDYADSIGGAFIYFPKGEYKITDSLRMFKLDCDVRRPLNIGTVGGAGINLSTIFTVHANPVIAEKVQNVRFVNITFEVRKNVCDIMPQTDVLNILADGVTFDNVQVKGGYRGLVVGKATDLREEKAINKFASMKFNGSFHTYIHYAGTDNAVFANCELADGNQTDHQTAIEVLADNVVITDLTSNVNCDYVLTVFGDGVALEGAINGISDAIVNVPEMHSGLSIAVTGVVGNRVVRLLGNMKFSQVFASVFTNNANAEISDTGADRTTFCSIILQDKSGQGENRYLSTTGATATDDTHSFYIYVNEDGVLDIDSEGKNLTIDAHGRVFTVLASTYDLVAGMLKYGTPIPVNGDGEEHEGATIFGVPIINSDNVQRYLVLASNIEAIADSLTPYELPVMTETVLGGAYAKSATIADTQEVHINSNGFLVTEAGGGGGGECIHDDWIDLRPYLKEHTFKEALTNAIADASEGDTIYIPCNTADNPYIVNGEVLINKGVTIIGGGVGKCFIRFEYIDYSQSGTKGLIIAIPKPAEGNNTAKVRIGNITFILACEKTNERAIDIDTNASTIQNPEYLEIFNCACYSTKAVGSSTTGSCFVRLEVAEQVRATYYIHDCIVGASLKQGLDLHGAKSAQSRAIIERCMFLCNESSGKGVALLGIGHCEVKDCVFGDRTNVKDKSWSMTVSEVETLLVQGNEFYNNNTTIISVTSVKTGVAIGNIVGLSTNSERSFYCNESSNDQYPCETVLIGNTGYRTDPSITTEGFRQINWIAGAGITKSVLIGNSWGQSCGYAGVLTSLDNWNIAGMYAEYDPNLVAGTDSLAKVPVAITGVTWEEYATNDPFGFANAGLYYLRGWGTLTGTSVSLNFTGNKVRVMKSGYYSARIAVADGRVFYGTARDGQYNIAGFDWSGIPSDATEQACTVDIVFTPVVNFS